MAQGTEQEEKKAYVKQKYAEIAENSPECNAGSCCGATADRGVAEYTVFSEDYSDQEGYHAEADLGLGCGIPTEGADIKASDTVLDLGAGAGNDCFVARRMVGEKGQVIGIDLAEEMVEKAKANRDKLGYENVSFLIGDIEDMPLEAQSVDVILSNCVLNLVPEKARAFAEMYRVLRKGGHFSVSDVVLRGSLPEALQEEAALYAGCVTGALQEEDYLSKLEQVGFVNVEVVQEKAIELPRELLENYLSEEEVKRFQEGGAGIRSITVRGFKP